MKKLLSLLFVSLLLSNCASPTAPSHLPSIFELPGAYIGAKISNAQYDAKRQRVKAYIIQHYEGVKADVNQGAGKHLEALLAMQQVVVEQQADAKQQLKNNYRSLFENAQIMTESIMRAYATLYKGTLTKEAKTLNGFRYDEASGIIHDYLNAHLAEFHAALREKDAAALQPLWSRLQVRGAENLEFVNRHTLNQYDAFFVEPVVVGFMVLN